MFFENPTAVSSGGGICAKVTTERETRYPKMEIRNGKRQPRKTEDEGDTE